MVKIKILMVHPGPDFSVHDVFVGWEKALRKQGHDVLVYNTNSRISFFTDAHRKNYETGAYEPMLQQNDVILSAFEGLGHHLYTFWPDLVVLVSAFYIRQEMLHTIRARGHKIAIIHTESPYQDDEQLARAQYASLNILNDPTNLEEYSYLSKSLYIPHAYDPETHFPGSGPKSIDFSFIGSMFPSRVKFFERMMAAIPESWLAKHAVAFGGQAWTNKELDNSPLLRYLGHHRADGMDNCETANTYRDTKVGINVYRAESEQAHKGEGWSMGPREVEMAACGMPFIRDSRPESDEVFPFLPAFTSPEHAAYELMKLLDSPERVEYLGNAARRAIEDRTFDNNARLMMRALADDLAA